MESYFSVHSEHGFTVVRFLIDSLTRPLELERVGHGLYHLIDEGESRRFLLDFDRVKYISSQAVGIILTMNKKLMQFPEGKLVLCAVGPQLLQLLKITRLDKILRIVPDQQSAFVDQPKT